MARRIKDANLQSREARRKLQIRDRLYVRAIDKDVAIGYRRTKSGAGTWWMRIYLGAQKYRFEPIGVADDLSDADGVATLDFWQAQAKVREAPRRATTKGPLTVADVIDDYVEYLEAHKKSAIDVRRRMDAHVLPVLGDIECSALTAERIHKWHLALARQPAMLRTARGAKRQYRKAVDDDGDNARARKVSANRVLAMLRAALNRAWRAGKISSDLAWRRVQPFKSVEIARQRFLTVAEAQRLINACDPDFRAVVRAALETGCRYGELTRLTVADLNLQAGTLAIRQSKSGRSRHVVLTDEGRDFFGRLCAGRAGHEVILRRDDGSPWKPTQQSRRMREACERAHISPAIPFHGLRHSWASLAVMAGMPLMVVARNLGHVDLRMVQEHYGHLASDYVADVIRAHAPRFDMVEPTNVRTIRY
jgi:integrase